MRTLLRISLALLCGGLGCVGGPVSDWPATNHDAPTGGRPAGSDDEDGVSTPSTRPVNDSPGSHAGRMDAGVARPPTHEQPDVPDGGDTDAGVPCVASDAGTCVDPCAAVWQRTEEGDDGRATGDLARLGCEPPLSDP